jgi:6-phosphogluconolactonase
MNLKIYKSAENLADSLAGFIAQLIREAEASGRVASIAISGGNTPKLLFEALAEKHRDSVNWKYINFYWVDERCVKPEDPESNYGTMRRMLLDKINIPQASVNRMRGEENPELEAVRYSDCLKTNLPSLRGKPFFDLVLLGIGDDGHTASIFPGNMALLNSEKICDVAVNPYTGQKRITLTGKVINNARIVSFLVTGKNKARIVGDIYEKNAQSLTYPAAYIVPEQGILEWHIDEDAGKFVR